MYAFKQGQTPRDLHTRGEQLSFPLEIRKYALLIALFHFLFCTGCAPTLDWYLQHHTPAYVPPEYVIELKMPEPVPLTQDPIRSTLVVTDFQDSRPIGETFDVLGALKDSFFVAGTLGIYAFAMAFNEDFRSQPFGDLGRDVPKLLAEYVQKAKLFGDTMYNPGGSRLYSNPSKGLPWLNKQNCDLILVGKINHFTGNWRTGGLISRSEGPSGTGGKVISEWHSLAEIYGRVSLSLKIIDAKTGNEVWNKDVDFREDYEKSIFVHISHSELDVKNELYPKQASSVRLARGETAGFTGTYRPSAGQLAG